MIFDASLKTSFCSIYYIYYSYKHTQIYYIREHFSSEMEIVAFYQNQNAELS